jgi:fibro-slime domain-containing protein
MVRLQMRGFLVLALLAGGAACGDDAGGGAGDLDGGGGGGLDDGGTQGSGDGGGAEECGLVTVVLRDFKADHPDMQRATGTVKGLVQPDLGGDGKPVYAPSGSTVVTEGAASFDQWYRDVPDVNMRFEQELILSEVSTGVFVFEDNDFFPLDGMGFPNEETLGHNFHFTTELTATFRYLGGEVFTFKGDDDVFVFVNNRLALDLGGVHGVQEGTIDFDAQATDLGISIDQVYKLDVFHAERHTSESNFRIETSIDCLSVIVD